ncbi:hypothetical protein [Tropicibacter alexandrii]|uniref:hypothetical protein n=1 Tax=Tropicibacter alexandrii TaxID=2267683 RepID=UPI000EF4B7C7|nr:hypothetical protein [Tropicibacter alexandrii]
MIAHRAAAYRDADFGAETMLHQDLWHGQGWPEELDPAKLGPLLLDDPDFAFLRRWFFAMAEGKPLPIDLMTRIALEIDQDVWDSGDPKAAAAAIAKIEDAWNAEQAAKAGRAPEFEPKDVSRLFVYPQSVIASVSHTSQTITQNFYQFQAATKDWLNETPEFLNALEAIPASLDRIGGILAHQAQSAASEQALREEIGRLKARVAQLEADLAAVKCAPEVKEKPWFKEVKILGPAVGAMLSAVGVVYWHVSDDETGLRQRNENIARQWDELWGEAEPKQSERQVQGARIADKR